MKKYLITLWVALLFTSFNIDADIQRRAVLDIGSGGTKVAIADVDADTNLIIAILFEDSIPVAYQASLDRSFDGSFDSKTMEIGLQAFTRIKEITDQHQVHKIVAVATSAFRKANNAKAFVEEVRQKTGIAIQIIPQREEGEIAFYSALALNADRKDDLVVWDIGTGSMQMTTTNQDNQLSVYMGEQMGSVAFKSHVTTVIQEKDVEELSPNPINEHEYQMADSYARAFGRKAHPIIKEKIGKDGEVIGIGRLFYHSIRPLASEDGVITRDGLRSYIYMALNKTDEELNNPFAHVDVTNCILALGIMKALHIQTIIPLETTATRGLLCAPAYWQD